jgi:hypothetical protein
MMKKKNERVIQFEEYTKLIALRVALIASENSGPPTPFDFDSFVARKRESETSAS